MTIPHPRLIDYFKTGQFTNTSKSCCKLHLGLANAMTMSPNTQNEGNLITSEGHETDEQNIIAEIPKEQNPDLAAFHTEDINFEDIENISQSIAKSIHSLKPKTFNHLIIPNYQNSISRNKNPVRF